MKTIAGCVPFLAVLMCALAAAVASPTAHAQAAPAPGAAVYTKYCASCHDQVDARIPTRASLTQMSPARILRTLDFGLMMSIASPIKRDDREAVAKFLGRSADDTKPPASAFCKPADRKIMSAAARNHGAAGAPIRRTRDISMRIAQD